MKKRLIDGWNRFDLWLGRQHQDVGILILILMLLLALALSPVTALLIWLL